MGRSHAMERLRDDHSTVEELLHEYERRPVPEILDIVSAEISFHTRLRHELVDPLLPLDDEECSHLASSVDCANEAFGRALAELRGPLDDGRRHLLLTELEVLFRRHVVEEEMMLPRLYGELARRHRALPDELRQARDRATGGAGDGEVSEDEDRVAAAS